MFFSGSQNGIPSRFGNYGLALKNRGPRTTWRGGAHVVRDESGRTVDGLGKGAIDHYTIAMVYIIDGGPRDSVGVF